MRHRQSREEALRGRISDMASDLHDAVVTDIEQDPVFDGVDAFAVAAQVRRLYTRVLLEEMSLPE